MKKILLSLFSLFLLVGCGNKEVPKEEPSVNESQDSFKYIIDPESKTRPFAVMINCHNDALPQAGLKDAYIVYELMVEGGITRMMALFKDIDSDRIGSIRSARTQYLGYANENDAIYVHAGGAPDAIIQIGTQGINDIDVDGEYGFRDSSLNRAYEHTLFTSTKLLNNKLSSTNMRTTTDTPNLLTYSKEEIDLSTYSDSVKAENISIKYSDYRTSSYSYDANTKTYLRYMNGKQNTDLVTKDIYHVKNIIVYDVNYTNYCYNTYCAYQKIDNIGSGTGYYISNGYAIPITWEKKDENSQTKYKLKSSNEPLIVNNGNTYIQIYPKHQNLNIK